MRSDDGDRAQVLVIDRDPDLIELLAYALRRARIDFITVHDAASAFEAFATWRPLVVVLDLYGLDMLEKLQAIRDDTAIIVLTADESDNGGVAALELGVDDYLTKPFSCNELVSSIRGCLLRDRLRTPAKANFGSASRALS